MQPIINLLSTAITLYVWVLIISAVLSWLVAFNVVNTRNQVVRTIGDICHRLTEPALRPIRQRIPNLGGIDISPIILILALFFVRDALIYWIADLF